MEEKKLKKIGTKEEYLKLIKKLNEHDKHYYLECRPIISDYEYDLLIKELERFEKEHKDLIDKNSPTQRIGEKPSFGFKKIKHEIAMYSLMNTYSKNLDNRSGFSLGTVLRRSHWKFLC